VEVNQIRDYQRKYANQSNGTGEQGSQKPSVTGIELAKV
jgi:hypothetical protein